jgi:hypothetical protein
MNDWNDETTTVQTEPGRRWRFPDAWSLIIGLVTLVVSAYALSDGALDLPQADPRWLIAGGALFVGLMLLGASIRPRRRDR